MEMGKLNLKEKILAHIFLMFSGLKFFVNTTEICFCCSEVFVDSNTYCTGPLGINFVKFCTEKTT